MTDMSGRQQMDETFDGCREALIDDFAQLARLMNERDYIRAAPYCYELARGLQRLSQGLANEALVRKIEDALDNPGGS